MKLDQKDLEVMALACLTRYPKAMDRALQRLIGEDHFVYMEEGVKSSYTKTLFTLVHNYWKDSGGSLFTSLVLEARLVENMAKDKTRAKFMTLWTEIEDCETDENDFYEILTQLKSRHCMRLMNQMFKDGHTTLTDDGIEKAMVVIQEGIDSIQTQLTELGADRQSFDISESADFFREEYDKRIHQPDLFRGIHCGLDNIDSKTFGWLPGQIIVFMAPSSGGKSVMMLNAAMHANRTERKNVLYFSFEMNSWLCLLRHLSLAFKVPYEQLKNVSVDKQELHKLIQKLEHLKGGPYFEYDVNMEDPTPEYIDSRIRELMATKGKPDLLVVDYIGNMTTRSPRRDAKDWENQSDAVQQLFIMAKRYGIPVITAQQINRDTIRDSRKSKENNKFMTYDQAAASGGQKLIHLCTYAIAMEPNRETGYCVLHPVKMRDAYFHPFPVRINSDYNEVVSLTPEEQNEVLNMHRLNGGAAGDKKASPSPSTARSEEDEETSWTPEASSEEQDLDLSDWNM